MGNVLIACEFSGVVRDAFLKNGHNAISCDLLPTENKGPHIQGDIEYLLKYKWDLIIAHPPCTYLCNSGVRWLVKNGKMNKDRYKKMQEGINFWRQFQIEGEIGTKVCIENPIPHKYAKRIMGQYSQIIQPWQFGHGETKATCLWLYNLPKLEATKIVSGREGRIHKLPPSKDRSKIRSITYLGIAEAMAEQWGNII